MIAWLAGLVQQFLDAADDQIEGDRVVTTVGDDDVGVAFARFDKFEVHGAHGGEVLFDDRFLGAPALVDVALQAADEAEIGVGVDKDAHVHLLAQIFITKDEDAFDEDHAGWLQCDLFAAARVGGKVVDWNLYSVAVAQLGQMLDQQRRVEAVGVIVILPRSFGKR